MAGHVWPPRRLIGRGWPKLSRRSSGQPGARSGAGTGLRRANWPKAEPPCLPHRHAEVAASLRLRSSTATLLAGRIVQLESQLSVASCRLKLVSRLQLLASALTLLVMLWRALLVESACADDLTHTPTNIDLARLAPWPSTPSTPSIPSSGTAPTALLCTAHSSWAACRRCSTRASRTPSGSRAWTARTKGFTGARTCTRSYQRPCMPLPSLPQQLPDSTVQAARASVAVKGHFTRLCVALT